MSEIIKAVPMYNFLNYCNNKDLSKKVLDLGAGGKVPPLYIFKEAGYEVSGIDCSEKQIKKAEKFSFEKGIELNIKKGDMRKLDFNDGEFSFVYSYNSIFHMRKEEINDVIDEMKRILKDNGLCFVNFLAKDDCRFGEGIKVSDSEFEQDEDGQMIMHSYFNDDEGEKFFEGFKIIYKEKRVIEKFIDNKKYKLAYIDYILEKV